MILKVFATQEQIKALLSPLNIQPVVVVRGLWRQQAAALTNFVGCFLLALFYFFFSLLLLSAEWPSLPQCLALCLIIIIHFNSGFAKGAGGVSVVSPSACSVVETSVGSHVVFVTDCARLSTSYEVSSVDPHSILGSPGRVCPGCLGQSLQEGFEVAAGQVTSLPGCVSEFRLSGSPLLLRVRRELGCQSGQSRHFLPLAPRDQSVHQPAGVEGHQAGSGELRRPGVMLGPRCVLWQCHCGGLPQESGDEVTSPESRETAYFSLGGEELCDPCSSVYDSKRNVNTDSLSLVPIRCWLWSDLWTTRYSGICRRGD